jgi:hypothetical protein
MTRKFWSDGLCHICGVHSLAKCDGCSRFACDGHSRQIKQGDITLDICRSCLKKIRPGMKVAGVIISKKALDG